jgi:hypothetical protein
MRYLIWPVAALSVIGMIYLPQAINSGFLLTFSGIKLSQIQITTPEILNLNKGTNNILSSSILIFSIMAFIFMIVNAKKQIIKK